MAQILIRGEAVYQCDTCKRKTRVLVSRDGIDVVQRCTITHRCQGKLQLVTSISESVSTPTFPPELPGVLDWFPRRMVYNHVQSVRSNVWRITHNLASKPDVHVYVTRQTKATSELPTSVSNGSVWYKSGSSIPSMTRPGSPGLYVFNGGAWVSSPSLIPVGFVGSDVFEYMTLTTPAIHHVDGNTLVIEFVNKDQEYGFAQCVSHDTASILSTSVNNKDSYPVQITNNGELTLATRSRGNYSISLTFHAGADSVTIPYTNIDTTPSILSAWADASDVFFNNKSFAVRSANIRRPNIPPGVKLPVSIAGDGGPDDCWLLSKPPFATTDKYLDMVVAQRTAARISSGVYYEDGELWIGSTSTDGVFPKILINS